MTDLVERLRASADHLVCEDGCDLDKQLREAADEIERLESKCSQVDRYIALLNGEIADNGKLRDEIERLDERVAELQAQCGYTESIQMVEIERLRAALDKIAKHPDTPELIRQYAAGMLEPKP